MSTSTRITLDRYHEMIRQGLFEPREEHHVELLEGEITPTSPVGPSHIDLVDILVEWSHEVLPHGAVRVRPQGPIAIPALASEPEPDLVWARRKSFRKQHPGPPDVLLLVEISDSSLPKDRGLKAQVYAKAGIADYWIANVPDQCIEVRRDSHGDSYRSVEVFYVGQEVRPLAFANVTLAVARIFPG